MLSPLLASSSPFVGSTHPSSHHFGCFLMLLRGHDLVTLVTLCYTFIYYDVVPWVHAREGYVTPPSPNMCYVIIPSHLSCGASPLGILEGMRPSYLE